MLIGPSLKTLRKNIPNSCCRLNSLYISIEPEPTCLANDEITLSIFLAGKSPSEKRVVFTPLLVRRSSFLKLVEEGDAIRSVRCLLTILVTLHRGLISLCRFNSPARAISGSTSPNNPTRAESASSTFSAAAYGPKRNHRGLHDCPVGSIQPCFRADRSIFGIVDTSLSSMQHTLDLNCIGFAFSQLSCVQQVP